MTTIEEKMAALAETTLTEIREVYEECVGDGSKSPNKKFLLRRIREAV